MKIIHKQWELFIPADLETVWQFFSRPENLNAITPKEMRFEVLSDISGVEMYAGMLILYNVTPILNIKMKWVTEITHIRNHQYFIDEQRFGPYTLWHHQHHFVSKPGGTLMKDILHYAIPFGPIGRIANAVFVENKVEAIFQFREKAVKDYFG